MGYFGHPASCHIKTLVKIPWVEIMINERKEVREGEIQLATDDASDLQDRLAHLGYR
jgi:hypothetical protein